MYYITTYRIHSSLKNNKEELIRSLIIYAPLRSAYIYGNKNRNNICHFYSPLLLFLFFLLPFTVGLVGRSLRSLSKH
jgi:hypothetical protein